MSGLVLELQADALNGNIRVSDLLRKALVVSKKLAVTQIEEWINKELNGYDSNNDIPAYREIRGEVKVFNRYHGWQLVNFETQKMAESLSIRKIGQPVGELDALDTKDGDGILHIPFPQDTINSLVRAMNIKLQPSLHVPSTELVGILDAVRNNILNWALQLEQEGILGEGMSFSNQEKQTASQVIYQITNNIGSMQNSQLQQASSGATQKIKVENDLEKIYQLVKEIKDSTDALELEPSDKEELMAEIITIESQAKSPRPKIPILSESLRSIRTILEGTASSILASGFLAQLSKYF